MTDYLLERNVGGRIADSMYEGWAGALWGGFEYPKTRAAAVYQVVVSFVFLITIAAYTANLAAFLMIEARPTSVRSRLAHVYPRGG